MIRSVALLVVTLAGLGARDLAAQRAAARQGIDVQGYIFRIALPDSGTAVVGRATILFSRRRSADTLRLDLVGMTVDSVKAASSEAAPRLGYRYDGALLRIALPPWRADMDAWYATVFYHGEPRDGLIIRPTARGRRSAFADNWPERARYWLPTVDHPSDKAVVRWEIEAPAAWRVVANGRQLLRTPLADGRVRWVFAEPRPIPTYTMVLGATEFAVGRRRPLPAGQDAIPIEIWTYPEDSAYADSVPFRRATEIVETMERLVGPYPFGKLAHVQSSTRFGAMENSTAIFYAERAYVEQSMGERTVRHETAHQWFGDAVTLRDWRHLWLSEGFASYFDYVIGAALDGDSVLARGMRENAETYLRSGVTHRPIVDPAVTDPMQLLNANNYEKAAWVLHMLRGVVGDSAFFRGVRDYYGTYRDSSVVSEDFQRVMERAAGRPLGWFFRQWLEQAGYPELDVRWAVGSAPNRVTLAVRQVQAAAWGRFRIPEVPVYLMAGGELVVRRTFELDPDLAEQTVSFSVETPPSEVRIDPDRRLLLKARVVRTTGP